MAIITKYYKTRKDGVVLNQTYSDEGRYVVRDGISYDVAIDPADLNRKYTEGELIPPIEPEPENPVVTDEIIEKAKAYDILTGVAE